VLQYPTRPPGPVVGGAILFEDESGRPVSCLTWAPCHPVTFPRSDRYSADYIGALRSGFRNNVSKTQATFVFLQGASGDLRPLALDRSKSKSLKAAFAKIFFGPAFGRHSVSEYHTWTKAMVSNLLSALEDSRPLESRNHSESDIGFLQTESALSLAFGGDHVAGRSFIAQSWFIGRKLFIGASCEPTSHVEREIQKSLSDALGCTTLIGCIGDSFGYLCSEKEKEEGGYEATGYLSSFGMSENSEINYNNFYLKLLIDLAHKMHDAQSGVAGSAQEMGRQ